jgi:hypothetical protein
MPWLFENNYSYMPHMQGLWGWNLGIPFFLLWSLVWGGLALWHAAKRNEKWWFIAFLFIHTAGILEIVYLVFVVKLFGTATQTTVVKKTKKKSR